MTATAEPVVGAETWYPPPTFETVADALGAMDHVEALAMLFEDLAVAGASVPELVATAVHMATERLPRGMSLTDARPGCWESSCFESMFPMSAVLAGPGAEPTDVECPPDGGGCGAPPDQPCWHLTTYVDLKHPHAVRVAAARQMTTYSPDGGWM